MSLLNIARLLTTHPLTRDSRTRAFLRFARWQVGGRLAPGPVVYEWVNDTRFLVRPGEHGLTVNIYTGLYEYEDMLFLLHALREDELFVDVGANAGSYTILACAAVGARGIAFEPIPRTYARLMENIRLNRVDDRVRALNVGVGRESGELAFTSSMGPTNHALAPGETPADALTVPVVTIDTVLEGENPSILKIDVEGFETAVVEGAQETLAKDSLHTVIMELNGSGARYGFDEKALIAQMMDHGFRMYRYEPRSRSLHALDQKNVRSENTIFLRDPELIKERVRAAAPVTVHGRKY